MDDNSIIELYFSRSEDAIRETDRKYGRYCRRIAENILSDSEETEECVNDTYLDVWNSIPPERPVSLRAFAGRITRNNAINLFRRSRREKRGGGQTDAVLSELYECTDRSSDVEMLCDSRVLADEIAEFLRGCSREKRIVFVQRYWYLMSIREISVKNNIKENQVKSILFRMRAGLKKHLKNRGLI